MIVQSFGTLTFDPSGVVLVYYLLNYKHVTLSRVVQNVYSSLLPTLERVACL